MKKQTNSNRYKYTQTHTHTLKQNKDMLLEIKQEINHKTTTKSNRNEICRLQWNPAGSEEREKESGIPFQNKKNDK